MMSSAFESLRVPAECRHCDDVGTVLRDAAAEAMEFTRAIAVTAVGEGTLAHLDAAVTNLNRSYRVQPHGELFVMARAYRHRVEELIQGPCTLREAQELYLYAAYLSNLLALLAHDLGYPAAAKAYAIDCYQHAGQVLASSPDKYPTRCCPRQVNSTEDPRPVSH